MKGKYSPAECIGTQKYRIEGDPDLQHVSTSYVMMYYNFVRHHSKLRMSPAMAAGVSTRLWEIGDIVALVEAEEAKADRTRGPYKKKISD